MQNLQSGSTTADTWLWRIDVDLREVGEEQYLLAQAVRTTYENYDRLMDELQTDLKRGDTEEAAALYFGEVTLCGGYLQQYTDELLQTAITEGQSTYTRLSALNERLKWVQAVTTLLCVLLGALFVRTVWHLLDPVQQMIVTSRAIGRGELDTPDVIVQQTDEIGQLAGAFNTMKHSMARQVNMLREKNEIERQLHRRETEAMEREALADLVARRFEHEAEIHTTDNGRRTVETALLWGGGPDPHGHRDAARTVLSRLPGCKVIFVTAYGLFQYAYEAMRLGACGYILKPVVPDEAEGAIRRALGQIEAERRLTAMAPAAVETDPADDDLPNTQMGQLMAQVKKYLRENYMYELSLDSIGDILHISPAYLSTQFKKYLHVGFLDYLTEVRIQAACELLRDPLRPTAEVAGMVGYEDASYFARAFKKKTGLTPTQYRRQAARSKTEAPL